MPATRRVPAAPTETSIRESAYYLWEADGRPEGQDLHYWLAALKAADAKPKRNRATAAKKRA